MAETTGFVFEISLLSIRRFRRSVVHRRQHEVHDYEQRPWREKKKEMLPC